MNKAFFLSVLFLNPPNTLASNQLDVQFKGELIRTHCQISADSVNKQIKLDNLRWQYINQFGASDVMPFFIEIEKCSDADLNKTIRMTWQSSQLINIEGNDYLRTQGTSGALLGIIEVDKNEQLIVWNSPIDVGVVSVVENRQQLNFGVFVRKPATGDIKVGDFKGTATFAVEYQ